MKRTASLLLAAVHGRTTDRRGVGAGTRDHQGSGDRFEPAHQWGLAGVRRPRVRKHLSRDLRRDRDVPGSRAGGPLRAHHRKRRRPLGRPRAFDDRGHGGTGGDGRRRPRADCRARRWRAAEPSAHGRAASCRRTPGRPRPPPTSSTIPSAASWPGQFPLVDAKIEPAGSVARARVYFKAVGSENWYYVEMTPAEAGSSASCRGPSSRRARSPTTCRPRPRSSARTGRPRSRPSSSRRPRTAPKTRRSRGSGLRVR